MAEKKKKESKLLKKCCCLTLRVGAFIVCVCFLVGIVLSFAYSLYNILLRGRGNAERRVAWALDGELRKEIYRAAVRAQQSYERMCTQGKDNFTDDSIQKTWDKKRRSPEILRFIKMLTPNFRVRHQRSVKYVSEYQDNFPKEQISKHDNYSLPDEEVSYQSFEVKPETNESQIIKVAPEEQRKMEYLVAANEKLTKKSPLVEEELGEKKEQGTAWSSEIAAVRRRRAYNHNTMTLGCVKRAERAKRLAAQFYFALLSSIESDFPRGAKIFYWRLDLSNVIVCVIYYILLMILVCGIIIDNRLMVLIWLATIPFYVIFSMIYIYIRFTLMMSIVGSNKGVVIFGVILLIVIPLVIFKYLVIFSYYCFMYSPLFWTMYSYNNMQMIVSRRGVDPNLKINS